MHEKKDTLEKLKNRKVLYGVTDRSTDPWWQKLNDPVLNSLIDAAVANNLDVQEAVSRVRQTRYERNIAQADLYPSLDGSG